MPEPNKFADCPGCGKRPKVTNEGKFFKHSIRVGKTLVQCDFAGTYLPKKEEPCPSESSSAATPAASSASRSPDDAKATAPPATPTTASSQPSPGEEDAAPSSSPATATGVETTESDPLSEYLDRLTETVAAQREAYRAEVNSRFSQPASHFSQPEPVEQLPLLAPPAAFSQPAGRKSEAPAEPMTDLGKELTARLKEMFYAYDNRRSADNRSAQATMGPSEMGTPCDRRLALSLMRMPAVNPGGDGWAAFVGTCIHAGLEGLFMWADAGTGRFAVEQRLEFDSKYVPKGTADLIDRTLFMLDDHKCQGRWSRNKLKSQGPSRTYRVQAHVYAHGARQRGERIEHVAIFSWPRDESTLDDLYVWTEPYNPSIVKEAFERVEGIGGLVESKVEELTAIYPLGANELEIKARVATDFEVADDCRFCPFYLPNARSPMDGCNGKR